MLTTASYPPGAFTPKQGRDILSPLEFIIKNLSLLAGLSYMSHQILFKIQIINCSAEM